MRPVVAAVVGHRWVDRYAMPFKKPAYAWIRKQVEVVALSSANSSVRASGCGRPRTTLQVLPAGPALALATVLDDVVVGHFDAPKLLDVQLDSFRLAGCDRSTPSADFWLQA